MHISKQQIEAGLDGLASPPDGLRFQDFAVALARRRWPNLTANSYQRDGGLDAYMYLDSPKREIRGICASISWSKEKVLGDAEEAKRVYPGLVSVVFITLQEVTGRSKIELEGKVKEQFGLDLEVWPWAELISQLRDPSNLGLCASHLRLNVSPSALPTADLLSLVCELSFQAITKLASKFAGKQLIELRYLPAGEQGTAENRALGRRGLVDLLLRGERLVIEALAGRGKTTTLVQMAQDLHSDGVIALIVQLPKWALKKDDFFDFCVANDDAFKNRELRGQDILRLADERQVVILFDGWNELSESEIVHAQRALSHLVENRDNLGFAIATRPHSIPPDVPGTTQFAPQRLTDEERSEFLHQCLGIRASLFRGKIVGDRTLDQLTRTPMYLDLVVSLCRSEGHS